MSESTTESGERIRIEDRAGENILIWPDGSCRPATNAEIFLDCERLSLLAERDALRAQRDDLRKKLQHLLIDPAPLTPTQLANLQKLLAVEACPE